MNKINDYKERAKRLRKAVSSVFKIECSSSQAYELMALEENYPNWDALSGVIKKSDNNEMLSTKEQMTQLIFFNEGIINGIAVYNILNFLKNQKNPIINKGWTQAELSFRENGDVSSIFENTHFFGDDVITLLKFSSMGGTFESSIKSAIDFLKMEYEWKHQIPSQKP